MTDNINLLETQINNTPDPLKKIELLLKFATEIQDSAPQCSLEQCQRAHTLLLQTAPDDYDLMGKTLLRLSIAHFNLNDHARSLSRIVEALPHLEKSDDLEEKAKAFLTAGGNYLYLEIIPQPSPIICKPKSFIFNLKTLKKKRMCLRI